MKSQNFVGRVARESNSLDQKSSLLEIPFFVFRYLEKCECKVIRKTMPSTMLARVTNSLIRAASALIRQRANKRGRIESFNPASCTQGSNCGWPVYQTVFGERDCSSKGVESR